MAEEGTFCINADVVKKAGANVNAAATAEAFTNNYILQSEGRIMTNARSDLKSDYGTLNAETKELLREASSNLAAVYAIQYDMSGFTSRLEAEDMINTLIFNHNQAMKILADQKTITYSGAANTVSGGITVREVDSTPTVSSVKTIVFPNGTVTDDGSGQATYTPAGGGSGDVVGPGSAVDDNIATFDTTTGKLIQDGGSTIAQVLARANHTGTQLASTISDFTTAVQTQSINNVVEDTTPQLGGELDAQANSIGFTQQTATGDGTTTINWGNGNKFKFTFGAFNETFTFTAPTKPGNFLLMLVQDGTGSRTATWPATVKWPSGTAPTLSTAAASIDIVSFYYDGTNYFGNSSLDFS